MNRAVLWCTESNECDKMEESKERMDQHIQENHKFDIIEIEAYACESCAFEGNDSEVMREHVIEMHTKKDKNKKFACEDCSFKSEKRDKLLAHFRKEHKKKQTEDNKNEGASSLEEEHRQLKNNFERLNTLFQESLEEVDKVKSEYTAKLIEASQKYRVTLKCLIC